ncbi:hypothetical protein OK016_18340 [Vibrio chagasii]|nr:hypothetical protein [Vibrio chagasii]
MIGYSDVTALLWRFMPQTGLVTFYGPALVLHLVSFRRWLIKRSNHSVSCCARVQVNINTYPKCWTDIKHDWEARLREASLRQ